MCLSDPILFGCLLTVFLPLSAFALIMIFTRDNPKLSLAISLVASTLPLIIAWTFFFKLGGGAPIIYNFDWLVSDLVKVPFGFLLDSTSLVMFVIVVLGGMGSIVGAMIAGIVIGIVEVFSGYLIGPDSKQAVYFLLFIAVLVFRPSGLFGLEREEELERIEAMD